MVGLKIKDLGEFSSFSAEIDTSAKGTLAVAVVEVASSIISSPQFHPFVEGWTTVVVVEVDEVERR